MTEPSPLPPSSPALAPRRSPAQAAWLSLDESDDAPTRFLVYFIAALQTLTLPALSPVEGNPVAGIAPQQELVGNIGRSALSILRSPEPPTTEAALTALINEIAALHVRIVLVLDDYQLIEAQSIHDALAFLLHHLPPQMHLVIATRVDPPLPLARLRARGQLTELRGADLRFSVSEAASFLNQVMALDLSAEDVAVLETRTEGWIAGLQLAALSMQGRQDVAGFIQSFAGSHRYVLDYLVEEALDQQSELVQTFVLQTAILDRLTGSLCDAVRFGMAETPSTPEGIAVTKQDSGQAILETLERANLFILHLDEERRWYRYHQLFSDLLRQRLRRTHPEWTPTLHGRASAWYERTGFIDEAIEHALRAQDFERAAQLTESQVDAMWRRGEHTRLRRWLAGLPAEFVFSKPHLCVFHAWDQFTCGQMDAAAGTLRACEEVLGTGSVPSPG
jgi:LuxR family maltose regulon positive regulatory protein